MQHQKPTPPIRVFCAAASSDAEWLAQWETHLTPLSQAKQITVWSERHVAAGTSRLQQINDHMDHAQVVVFLLSANFFAEDFCITLMERALSGSARVIPLLISPVDWKASKLSNLACLPSGGEFVTNWKNQDDAFHTCVQELRQLLGLPAVQPQSQKPARAEVLQNQNRVRMLRRLHLDYDKLMKQSLQGAVWLELGLTEKPDAVQNRVNSLLRVSNRAEQHLPPNTSITKVCDEAEHELLILGEPGAGKSTLLLDLAQQLVRRAEQDDAHSLPVILPLSSWAVKRLPLQDWIAEQLAQIYDVPHKLSVQWVREDGILPLLDGLDEMEETARSACIAAINTYHRDHMAKLVVCSRTIEYEATAERHRLALQGAVVVQPLTHEYVETYLVRAGKPLAALRSAVKKNAALHDLATTPLMLNILILTYQGIPVRGLSNREALLLQQVWDDYIHRMVERKGNHERYPLRQTRTWLNYLAQQMLDHNRTVFYLEHLQPDWLSTGQQRAYTWLGIRLPGILIGILTSLMVALFLDFPLGFWYTTITELTQHSILGGFLGGIFSEGTISSALSENTHSHSHRRRITQRIATSFLIGLSYGLSFGLSLSPGDYGLSDWLRDGSISGIIIGLSCWFLLSLSSPQRTRIASQRTVRRWLYFLRLLQTLHGQRMLLVMVAVGGVTALSKALSYGLRDGLSIGLKDGLNTGVSQLLSRGIDLGLSYGFIGVLISLILTKQAMNVELIDRLRWTWGNMRSLVTRMHGRITILLTLGIAMMFGLSFGLSRALNQVLSIGLTDGLNTGIDYLLSRGLSMGLVAGAVYGVSYGLTCGLNYWLLMGLLRGVESTQISDEDRRKPNQGIKNSARNSIWIGIISAILIGLTVWSSIVLSRVLLDWLRIGLSQGLNYPLNKGWDNALQARWLIVCCACGGGLLACAVSGGLAVLRHAVLRILLWRNHAFPLNAPGFLEDAKTRNLLRSIGGGYGFTHSLLRDHFADLNSASSLTPPTN